MLSMRYQHTEMHQVKPPTAAPHFWPQHSHKKAIETVSNRPHQVKVWTRSHENPLHAEAAALVKTVIDEANLEPGPVLNSKHKTQLKTSVNKCDTPSVSGREFSMSDSINFKPDENSAQRQSFDEWVQVQPARARKSASGGGEKDDRLTPLLS